MLPHQSLPARALSLLLAALLCGCAARQPKPLLFDQLGGHDGITAIVEGLLFRLADDPRIGHHFADADILRLHEKLIEQFCVEADGSCTYTGKPMAEVHAGRQFTDGDFNALVENLLFAMEDLEVPVAAQNRLVERLARMHGDVVYR